MAAKRLVAHGAEAEVFEALDDFWMDWANLYGGQRVGEQSYTHPALYSS